MDESSTGWCARCDQQVEVERKYSPQTRRRVRLYLFMPLILVPMFPFIAWDYIIALPIFMLYMLGIGPVLLIVREPGVCCECGALVAKEAPRALR